MKFSIVTPSYQQAQFLPATIESITNTSVDLEYLVVDGGSVDGSVEVLQRYNDRIAWWVSEPDKGQTDAINKGLQRATGDVLAYLNSDDLYLPGTLETVQQIFTNNPDVQWIAGAVENFRGDEVVKTVTPVAQDRLEIVGRHRYSLHQPGIFWRRQLTDQLGLFDDTLHYCFDHEYWVRFVLAGHLPYLTEQPFARFRLHEDSKTCAHQRKFIPEDHAIAARYRDQLSAADWRTVCEYLDQYEAKYFTQIVYGILQDQGRTAALAYLAKATRVLPKLDTPKLYLGALTRTLLTGSPPKWF